jgi:predicted RNase H-like nuclease (RuvC/YqgF family)
MMEKGEYPLCEYHFEDLEKVNATLRAEAEKDYEDMRRFQKAYIEADQECRHLRAEVERLKSELGKWTRKHDDADLEEMRQQAQCLSLSSKVAYINALEHHLMHSKSDLAAAVEVLTQVDKILNRDSINKLALQHLIRALLARLEVK